MAEYYKESMTREPAPPDDPAFGRLSAALSRLPVVGIIRGCPPDHLVGIATAAAGEGLVALEVTLDSPDPLRGIETLASSLPDIVVGAGTVHTAEEAGAAIEAGASFIVSPTVSGTTVDVCVAAGIPSLPGAATPTEISAALKRGAYAAKVFPAKQLGGPDFIKAVLAPLHHPRLVPTGGIDAGNAGKYLSAGAHAVGVGGSIFSRESLLAGDAMAISEAVKHLREALE